MDAEGLVATLLRWLYQKISPRQLGVVKPQFAWLPRYTFDASLPDDVLTAENAADQLEVRLAEAGFALEYWTREQIVFSRGKPWGDFSIKLIPLRLRVSLPLQSRSRWIIEAAGIALFDTGDVWELAREVKNLLQRSTNSEPETS